MCLTVFFSLVRNYLNHFFGQNDTLLFHSTTQLQVLLATPIAS